MILHQDVLDSTYLAFTVIVSLTPLGVPIVIVHPQSSLRGVTTARDVEPEVDLTLRCATIR